MWVFMNDAFVSIVQDRVNDDLLWVRGRIKGDVEKFFKPLPPQWRAEVEREVERTPSADYLYRICVPRTWVRTALEAAEQSIDYTNFKNSIPPTKKGDMRHTYYMRVWSAMLAFQHDFKRRFKK